METHDVPNGPAKRHSRRLRWMIGLALLAVLLACYVIALRWFTQRVETDVHDSIRPLPVAGEPVQR